MRERGCCILSLEDESDSKTGGEEGMPSSRECGIESGMRLSTYAGIKCAFYIWWVIDVTSATLEWEVTEEQEENMGYHMNL